MKRIPRLSILETQEVPWSPAREDAWQLSEEGELGVDVYETADDIIVRTAVAGVKPEDLSLSVSHDLLTIRGSRHNSSENQEGRYLLQECHWGTFSRSIILPTGVDLEKSEATLKNGILAIRLPKHAKDTSIPILNLDNDADA